MYIRATVNYVNHARMFRTKTTTKLVAILALFGASTQFVHAQSVGISNSAFTPNANSVLELKSTDKGVLLPRLTSGERTTLGTSLGAGDEGMTVYNTTDDTYEYWNGSSWTVIGAAGGYDDDWTVVGGDVERQSGNVYIGDLSTTDNDLYISDLIIDWDNSSFFLDPSSESRVNEIEFNDGSTSDPSVWFDGDANSGLYQPANNEIGIVAAGNERLRVVSSGVAIGGNADAPDAILDVIGENDGGVITAVTLRNDFTTTGTATALRLVNSTNPTSDSGGEIQAVRQSSVNGLSDLIFNVHGSGGASGDLEERMRIAGDGEVTIGSDGFRGKLSFYAEQGATDYAVTFAASAATTQNSSYTLPPDDGDSDYVLRTDGSGVLTWADPALLPSDADWTISGSDMYSGVADNVGIGSTSPYSKLEVYDPAGTNVTITKDGTDASSLFFRNGTGGSTGTNLTLSTAEHFTIQNTITDKDIILNVNDGGTQKNMIFVDASVANVGIGNSSPQDKLHISGSARATATIKLNDGSATSPSYRFYNDLNTGIYAPDDDEIAITTAGTQRMIVDAGGNIGMGTNTPSSRLEVYDDPGTNDFLVKLTKNSNIASELVGIGFGSQETASLSKSAIMHERESANGTGKLHFLVDDAVDAADVSLSESRMTIDRNGLVGIGTTIPTNELDVDGQIRMRTGATSGYIPVSDANGVMTWSDPSSLNGDFIQNQTGSYQTADFQISGDGEMDGGLTVGAGITIDDNNVNNGDVADGALAFGNASGEGISSNRSGGGANQFGLDFYTNSINRIAIDNNGLVGINNSNPGNPLHVVGLSTADFDVARFDGSSTFGAAVRVSSTAAGGRDWTMISTANAAGEGAGKLLFKDETGGNVRMTIENGGDVGIGTTDPQSQFHVVTTQTGNVIKLHNTGLANGSLVGHEFGKANSTNNMAEFRYNHVSDGNSSNYVNLGLWGNANTLVVQGSGRIGLGTTTPLITMDATQGAVYGSTATSGSQHDVANRNTKVSFGSAPSNNTSEFAGMRVVVGAGTNGCGNTSDIRFDTWECNTSVSREVMRISGRGRVGIGTNNPSIGMLHVNGATNHDLGGFAYFAYSGCNVQGCAGGTKDVSIYATGRVIATEFNAHSDARIKNIHGVSNGSEDLTSLMGIEITDYTYKDHLKGDQPFKKVIAQQVEEVYPQAVTNDVVETVPDIYTMAFAKEGYIALKNDLKKGERVKLLFEDATETVEVLDATADGFTVATENEGSVFVYGREVSDFRTVDYEAIAMLNVSATQEMYKLIQKLQKENAEIKAELNRIDILSSELEEIKASLGIGLQTAK